MNTHEFAIVASGLHPDDDDFEDRLFEAGCDDATIAFQKGVIVAEFAREGVSFEKALQSAIEDMRRAGTTVDRIEPDTLVSLSDIAERAGLTRQAISLYANGERGEHFPTPIARVTSNMPLWDWCEVAQWMLRAGKLDEGAVEAARAIHSANSSIMGTQLAA